jgi:RNA polymerase sigma-B factor
MGVSEVQSSESDVLDVEDARFLSWLDTCLRHEAIRSAKRYKRIENHELLVLNRDLSEDAEEGITELIQMISSDADTLAEVEQNIVIQDALSLLTPQQQVIISATVLEDRTAQEVADNLGITKQAVSQMKRRALKRLRKWLMQD